MFDVAGVLAVLDGVFASYEKQLSDFDRELFLAFAKEIGQEEFKKALVAHVRDPDAGKFAPRLANIVAKAHGTSSNRAALAWSRVQGALASVGAYSDVCFDDAAIHQAITDLGGWPKVCRTEINNLSYVQHAFQVAYSAAESGIKAGSHPRLLHGERSSDDEYAKIGLKPPKPAVIGDIAKARTVYKTGDSGGVAIARLSAFDLIQKQSKGAK